jgi:hypothetical protein
MLWQNRWRGMHTNLVDAKDHKNKEYMSWSKSTTDTMKNKFGGCHWGSKSQDHGALVKELDDWITTMPWAKSMLAMHDICCAHLLWKLSSLRVFFSSLYHGQRPRPRIQIIGCQRPKIQRPQSCDKKTDAWHYGLRPRDHGCWPQYHGLDIHQIHLIDQRPLDC